MLKRRREKRYKRCLARIDRLERELFPEWFPKNDPWEISLAPGSVIPLNPGGRAYFLTPPNNHTVIVESPFA